MSIMPGLDWNQEGKTRPLKVEKPRMRRFREELRSTYCRGREFGGGGGRAGGSLVQVVRCMSDRQGKGVKSPEQA